MTEFEKSQAKLAGEILRALKPAAPQAPEPLDRDAMLALAKTKPQAAKAKLDAYQEQQTAYLLSKPTMALTTEEKSSLLSGICDLLRENGYAR
jgi:hypothetical protein